MLLVNIRAGKGTPPGVVQEKIFGAWGGTVTESPIRRPNPLDIYSQENTEAIP